VQRREPREHVEQDSNADAQREPPLAVGAFDELLEGKSVGRFELETVARRGGLQGSEMRVAHLGDGPQRREPDVVHGGG
jgi:hypothetical protein